MARSAAKPAKPKAKPKPRPPAAGGFRPRVHVRMYCQGLGDCFLLRFEPAEGEFVHVLIDCGIYKASPGAAELMRAVAADVAETTGNTLDVLVVTHEHWDHISGFHQAADVFAGLEVGAVWQAWTENPADPLAAALRARYETAKARLTELMGAARAAVRPGAAPPRGLAEADSVMGFLGVDRDGGQADAYAGIRRLLAGKNPRYLSPGQVESLPVGADAVDVFVLGPPADEAALRRQDIARRDAYHKQQVAFFDGFDTLLRAVAGGLSDARAGNPFDPRQEVPAAAARGIDHFRTLYPLDGDPAHPEAFRAIDDLPFDALGGLALRMDRYVNNTSLVLAFRLPGGDVLLFPGDAQGGNWKSWADPDEPLRFPDHRTDAGRLLAATVLYKVAHHGSHNATPRTYGLDRMTSPRLRALVPVDGAVARGAGYGEMPLVAIMDALAARTGGAVARSDGVGAPAAGAVFRFADRKLQVPTARSGKPVERPLYCETTFDLG